MSKSSNDTIKARQVRAAVRGTPVMVRLQADDLAALDAYRTADEPMTRPQAIRAAMTAWLRTHGYAPKPASKAAGPATNAIVVMDAAIKANKSKRKR